MLQYITHFLYSYCYYIRLKLQVSHYMRCTSLKLLTRHYLYLDNDQSRYFELKIQNHRMTDSNMTQPLHMVESVAAKVAKAVKEEKVAKAVKEKNYK